MPIISNFPALGGGTPGPDYSSWFGTGEDGDLTVSTDVALPVALDSGQIIKQYNNLTITSTGVLHPANRCNGMILLVKGDLTVDGTIHVDKCAPLLNDNEEMAAQEQHIVLCGVTTGGKGGDGGDGSSAATARAHGTGGQGFRFGGGYGAGSGSVANANMGASESFDGANGDRPPAGTTIPWIPSYNSASQYGAGGSIDYGFAQLHGGGGPGGTGAAYSRISSASYTSRGENGDAIGGGAIWIFVGGAVDIGANGVIRAKGGNGANGRSATESSGNTVFVGGGGAGGGGIVCIVHTGNFVNAGVVQAPGGSGGAAGGGNSTAGSDGASGTVLITNIADLLEDGGDGYEWATISTVSGGAGTAATGIYCVTSDDGHPIAVELSGQQQIPVLVGSYLRDDYSWTVNEFLSDVEAVGTNLYLIKGDVFLSFMGPS